MIKWSDGVLVVVIMPFFLPCRTPYLRYLRKKKILYFFFNLALYGRNSDSPCIVIAPSTPANCFEYMYQAARLTIEHMTPVIFLSDGYLANGSEPWKLPSMADLPEIKVPQFKGTKQEFQPYLRDPKKLSRYWVIPGMAGLEHRLGGLEKEDITGNIFLFKYSGKLF